ncbi:hypothetical protein M2390_002930 [Mycetocola sp. BIGb0189]|uniref:hypothetical protein n=1 Tax=Mycetocola sp. BIGb0189 TaxID=2940604 RepID=UPI002168B08F|nr:hypothetical protein [Mycetocola sp. BIGb0189]MCS4277721.1 hypothetical protein [Mycetocola sp. BIGb0189]
MAGSPLVDLATLAGWLAVEFEPDSTEEKRAGIVLGSISDYARAEARRDDWTIANVPGDVSTIVLMVAARVMVNPDGKTSVTIEDVTRRWESGEIFSESELRALRKYRKGSSGGLGSIQFTRTETRSDSYRVPVEGGRPVTLYDGRGY